MEIEPPYTNSGLIRLVNLVQHTTSSTELLGLPHFRPKNVKCFLSHTRKFEIWVLDSVAHRATIRKDAKKRKMDFK